MTRPESFDIPRNLLRISAAALLMLSCNAALADTSPKLDHSSGIVLPDYPDQSQRNGEQGDALIGVHVNDSGRPSQVKLKRSSGFDDLDNKALAAALGWRYVPAVENGDTASGWMDVRVRFQLPQADSAAPAHAPTPIGQH